MTTYGLTTDAGSILRTAGYLVTDNRQLMPLTDNSGRIEYISAAYFEFTDREYYLLLRQHEFGIDDYQDV